MKEHRSGFLVKAGVAERLENKKRSKEAQEECIPKVRLKEELKKLGW